MGLYVSSPCGAGSKARRRDGLLGLAARLPDLRHAGHGAVVDAALYQLPDELIGPAKVFLLFVPGDTLLVAGDLVAYDGSGAELREYFDLSPVSLYPKVLEESPPEAVAVMKDLQLAGSVVGRYFKTHGSYSGLDPDSASATGGATTPSTRRRCTNGWLDPSAGPPPSGGDDEIATGSDPNGNLWSLTLLDVSGPGAETPHELELIMGPIGASLPIKPLGGDDLGSVVAVPPTATPVDAPAVPDLPTSVWVSRLTACQRWSSASTTAPCTRESCIPSRRDPSTLNRPT